MGTINVRPLKVVAVALAAVGVTLALMLSWGHGTRGEAEAVDLSGVNFSMSINGCDEGTVTTKGGDATCSLASGGTFTVNFDLDSIPILPDAEPDGVFGYEIIGMAASFSGVQYKTGTYTALHGQSIFAPREPPLGTFGVIGLTNDVIFHPPCTPPDEASFIGCESTAKGLTMWTADFNCGNSGFIALHPMLPVSEGGAFETYVRNIASLTYRETDSERITVNCPPKPAVGGIALDTELRAPALETLEPSSGNAGLLLSMAAAVATGIVALCGDAWQARRPRA